ncbi:amino acid ABC transporter substrate-binding protein [Cellulomonas sp. WB94]|uniref:transporter substrate-binding domain-containing protein n=1 Tax=Cellulomonas sp. WB94 TaxID=2173174 RepID=UPI000D572D09|nr:transporter substrate-binding domain-containing protein [Cellulomonas sp. WB94]PVU81905.1 amino acid ABC transporter substrate-binding protein [Cellulomonas sp. WB94]
MKTALRLIPLGLAAALALTGCASSSSPAASTAATEGSSAASTAATADVTLVDPGKLTVCTNPPYEPFEFSDASGNIVGLDIDIVGEVAKDLGVELVTTVTPFEGIQSGANLDTGSCDVVASGITITPDRQAKIDFSDPYFNADQGLLVAEGSDLKDIASLKGKNIAVQQATTGETWAKDNGLEAVTFEDLGLQIQALKTGQVDAVVNDIAVLGPFVSQGFKVAANFSTGEQYGLGVKKGNTALVTAINTTLARIHADGTYDAIYTARIGTAPTGS